MGVKPGSPRPGPGQPETRVVSRPDWLQALRAERIRFRLCLQDSVHGRFPVIHAITPDQQQHHENKSRQDHLVSVAVFILHPCIRCFPV